jgi:hypothetical protein
MGRYNDSCYSEGNYNSSCYIVCNYIGIDYEGDNGIYNNNIKYGKKKKKK